MSENKSRSLIESEENKLEEQDFLSCINNEKKSALDKETKNRIEERSKKF